MFDINKDNLSYCVKSVVHCFMAIKVIICTLFRSTGCWTKDANLSFIMSSCSRMPPFLPEFLKNVAAENLSLLNVLRFFKLCDNLPNYYTYLSKSCMYDIHG